MKQKLEALAEEMITEVKNLKDLAKDELPEVAKEYMRFQYATSLALAALLTLPMIGLIVLGLFHTTANPRDQETFSVCMFLIASFFAVFSVINIYDALKVKLMPRATAIEAVTRLLK